jgi:hypothetical protein
VANETIVFGGAWTRGQPGRRVARASTRRARLGLLVAFLVGFVVPAAQAIDMELKREWQDRYRELRLQAARLEVTAELATKEYADANRRNYRRSGVRHFHRANAIEARTELVRVQKEMGELRETVRAAGLPVSWLDEVDEEPLDLDRVQALGDYSDEGRFGGRGADAPEPDQERDANPEGLVDDGRNPLYKEPRAAPAGIQPLDETPYDYEEWLKERQEAEGEEAR